MSLGVVDWDPARMDPGLNGYMTLVHESGHWLELPHNFDRRGQVADMPADDAIDPGNVYEYNDWPRTDGEPHDICNVMGYEADFCMTDFHHDQCTKARNTLRFHPIRSRAVIRIAPIPPDSWLAQPLRFRHAIPRQDAYNLPLSLVTSDTKLEAAGVAAFGAMDLPMQHIQLGSPASRTARFKLRISDKLRGLLAPDEDGAAGSCRNLRFGRRRRRTDVARVSAAATVESQETSAHGETRRLAAAAASSRHG